MRVMLDHAPAYVASDGHKSLLARLRFRELRNARVPEVAGNGSTLRSRKCAKD